LTDSFDIPDVLQVEVPVGGRVMVVADLHLSKDPRAADVLAVNEIASALEAATGPGVLIFAGNLFDSGADPAQSLAVHNRLADDVAEYAEGSNRRVVILPGDRDSRLAWSEKCRQGLRERLGAEFALAAELTICTGAGERKIRVEPGHDLDPLSRRSEPRNPRESPFAQHVREEVMPAMRRRQGEGRHAKWLSGMEDLDQPAALSRFIASRLVYRRLGRSAWLLLIPVIVALVLRLPAFALRSARHAVMTSRVSLAVFATVIELALLFLLAVAALRRTGLALSALALDDGGRDPNDPARSLARGLVTEGYAGLITGHTCRPELAHLGDGFYANAGCSTEVVSEYRTRVPGLGLPSVFMGHRQLAWVELEAGNDLHVRLLHGRQDLPGATMVERLLAERLVSATPGEIHAEVAATWPQGSEWPRRPSSASRDRRVRRLAAFVVFAAGLLSLLSALSEPLRNRLDVLRELFPTAIPETASALVALGGIGLIVLARGIRRGQRRAWFVCQVLLLVVALLHVIKGVDVEEALIAVAVAVYLWIYRASFQARTDVERVGPGLMRVCGAAVLTALTGSVALELSMWINRSARDVHRLSWAKALEASIERMVGVTTVPLPHRIDMFFSPTMAAAGAGLALAFLVVLFRPVVQRRHAGGPGQVGPLTRPPARNAQVGVGSSADDLSRARAVVARHGGGTLDYFALRPDKQFFFWGETVVAHAVYGGVCLVSPDPIGPIAERAEAWRAFRAYVDEHGWALGGLGIGEEWLPVYRSTGMHDLYVGDEAIVRVNRFSLEGGRFKGLRQAVNRIAKYGYTISFHDPSDLDPAMRQALEEVMTRSRRGDVERGFSMTLGRVFDPDDRGLLLAVVHGPAGESGAARVDGNGDTNGDGGTPSGPGGAAAGPPVAFCQYVPAPGIGGYSLDLMRRDNGEHPNGLIDFAVVETIRELKRRGNEGLGLNFATMRAVLAGETGEGISQRVQAWLLRRMGDSMQIESLWRFNAKFDPDWQPRYAIYDAPENMLAVAIAVARAESFWELPVIGRFLVPPAPVG
jgi:lysylphosphatidylglycerol synthetase-like protein (DUF2156 family)